MVEMEGEKEGAFFKVCGVQRAFHRRKEDKIGASRLDGTVPQRRQVLASASGKEAHTCIMCTSALCSSSAQCLLRLGTRPLRRPVQGPLLVAFGFREHEDPLKLLQSGYAEGGRQAEARRARRHQS